MIETFHTHVVSKTKLTEDVYLIKFALVQPPEITFNPGQYLVLFVPQIGETHARRLYSIASPSTEIHSFELLAKIIPGGLASEYFLRMTIGEEVLLQGPAGRFIYQGNNRNKVFLATGTGLAPMRSMLKTLLPMNATPLHTTPYTLPELTYHLLWGMPYYKDVYFLDEFKHLAATYPNFTFTIALSRETGLENVPETDRTHFKIGRITNDLAVELNNTDYYLCGNRDVVESLRNHLMEQKVDNTCVIFEKF